jgi:hypothetical protein
VTRTLLAVGRSGTRGLALILVAAAYLVALSEAPAGPLTAATVAPSVPPATFAALCDTDTWSAGVRCGYLSAQADTAHLQATAGMWHAVAVIAAAGALCFVSTCLVIAQLAWLHLFRSG